MNKINVLLFLVVAINAQATQRDVAIHANPILAMAASTITVASVSMLGSIPDTPKPAKLLAVQHSISKAVVTKDHWNRHKPKGAYPRSNYTKGKTRK